MASMSSTSVASLSSPSSLSSSVGHSAQRSAAQDDVGWLVSRHPAVMRLLERELGRRGSAFVAGRALASRVLGGRKPLGELELDHNTLNSGMVAVRSGRCDRAMVRSIRDQIDELRIALLPTEQDAVATVIAAIIWSVLDASARALDDTLVA